MSIMSDPVRKVASHPLFSGVISGVVGVAAALGTRYVDGRVGSALMEERVKQAEIRNDAQDRTDQTLLAATNSLALSLERVTARQEMVDRRLDSLHKQN